MRPLLEEVPSPPGVAVDEGIRRYELVCLVALTVLVLGLWQQGLGTWTLAPLVIGLVGLGRSIFSGPVWRAAPLALVLVLAVLLATQVVRYQRRPDAVADLLLCVTILAYVVGHFRMQGLVLTPLPLVPRPPGPSTRPIPDRELPTFLVSLPFWAGLALFAWSRVPDRWHDFDIVPQVWRTVVVLWALGVALVVAAGAFGYLQQRRLRPPEAALFLQDMLWHETRWEQRIIQRWVAAVRLRQKRKTIAKRTGESGASAPGGWTPEQTSRPSGG